jgi:glucosamine 6-phosphate synthetase-like amidotransferase/phosphosugar isomerase protein
MKPNDVFFEVATGKKDSDMYKLAVENFQEIVKKRQPSNAILIKEANNKSVEQELNGVDFIDIPETSKEFSPLFSTIRFQQLTNSITKKLGIDPDNGGGVLTKFRQSLSM